MIVTFMKTKFIKTEKKQTQTGFGLLETTAAAMLSLLFVSMGANLVLTANLYKIKAKRNDVMNSLIRADVESIKYQSTKLQGTSKKCNPKKLRDSFAWELKNSIGTNSLTTVRILGNKYILTRTINLDTNGNKNLKTNLPIDLPIDPANDLLIDPDILPISYEFTRKKDPDEPVSTSPSESEYDLTVQIIPNASLQCSTPTAP